MRKRKRNDIAWQYCTVVDGNFGRVRCNFCRHVMWGGVTRLKQHLACIKGNVIPCRRCPPEVAVQIRGYLGQGSQKGEESVDGGSEQVNDMRGRGNEEQSQEDQEYWHELMGVAQVIFAHSSPKNEENTNGGSEQDCRPKLAEEIHDEYVPHHSQENEENIDGGSEQVNDLRWEGNDEQLQPTEVCWQWSAGDDMSKYFSEETSGHGWGARNSDHEMELKLKNDEYKHALEAVRRVSKLTFWEDRIRRSEGCSGTKPGPSCLEYSMTSDGSDDNSELGF